MKLRFAASALAAVLVVSSIGPRRSAAAPPNGAAPTKAQCVAAYQGAQIDLKASALASAREKLGVCLSASCSKALHADCAEWLRDVERRQPSVVLSFKGKDGTMRAGVPATLDGRPLEGSTDGRSVEVDPGEHVFVLAPPGEPEVTVRTLVREGEKAQRVDAVSKLFAPPAVAPEPPRAASRPIPWTVYAAGGLSLVALGAAAGFGISGVSSRADLDACKPRCPVDDVSSVRTRFTVADVSLVVALLAAGATTVLYLTRPEEPSRTSARRPRFALGGLVVELD